MFCLRSWTSGADHATTSTIDNSDFQSFDLSFIGYVLKRIFNEWSVKQTFIHSLIGECPKARFQFKNQTAWAFYNFLQSYVGNIGSLETCPCKFLFFHRLIRKTDLSIVYSSIDTGRPYVYLPCYTNSSWGDEPYFSSCIEPPTTTTSSTTITTEPLYMKLSLKEMAQVHFSWSISIICLLFR